MYLHASECLAHETIVHHAAYLLFCRDFLTNLMCGALESYSGRFTPMAACPTPLWWVLGTDTYAQCEQHCNKVTYFCIALADFFCDDCVIRIWNKVWIRHFSGAPPLWCSTAFIHMYLCTVHTQPDQQFCARARPTGLYELLRLPANAPDKDVTFDGMPLHEPILAIRMVFWLLL